MIKPAQSEINPVEVRRITKFTEEHPEVMELLVSVWNQATWSAKNPRSTSSISFPSFLEKQP